MVLLLLCYFCATFFFPVSAIFEKTRNLSRASITALFDFRFSVWLLFATFWLLFCYFLKSQSQRFFAKSHFLSRVSIIAPLQNRNSQSGYFFFAPFWTKKASAGALFSALHKIAYTKNIKSKSRSLIM